MIHNSTGLLRIAAIRGGDEATERSNTSTRLVVIMMERNPLFYSLTPTHVVHDVCAFR